jgi:hypothetical protein
MLLEAIGAALHERFLGVTTYQTRSDISIIAIVTVSGTISRMVMAHMLDASFICRGFTYVQSHAKSKSKSKSFYPNT